MIPCQRDPFIISRCKYKLMTFLIRCCFIYRSRRDQMRMGQFVNVVYAGNKIDGFSMKMYLVIQCGEVKRSTGKDDVHHQKRTIPQTSIQSMVMRKFGLAKVCIPRFEIVAHQALMQIPEWSICHFCLRMIRGTHIQICTKNFLQRPPKMTEKPCIVVGDNRRWKLMQPIDFTEEKKIDTDCIHSFLAWNEVSHLLKSIDRHRNRIVPFLSLWKSQNKIHPDIHPKLCWNR